MGLPGDIEMRERGSWLGGTHDFSFCNTFSACPQATGMGTL
jgi:hypothetical protein